MTLNGVVVGGIGISSGTAEQGLIVAERGLSISITRRASSLETSVSSIQNIQA
jgi:hypothetical protein